VVLRALALALLIAGCDAAPIPTLDLQGVPLDGGSDLSTHKDTFVSAAGGDLFLGADRFRFVGANRYDLASGRFVCGNVYSDDELDRLLGELRQSAKATVVRAWAFETFTVGGTDFSSLDRLIATARKHDLRLILTLENEWKDCTEPDAASGDGRKSGAWYAGGYQAKYPAHVERVVTRYKDEPQIAMWQLMNEAESTDGAALLAFTIDMAARVKQIDARHLLSLGTIGTGQAGTSGVAFGKLHEVPGIDVVESHDYGDERVAMPGKLAANIQLAAQLNKPFIIGEAGIAAPSPMYPFTRDERAALFDAKLAAHWSAGTDGFLVWSFYNLKSDNWQGWDFAPQDPLASVLATYATVP
jgi:mannan endo-1,4-beta-mannosidase